MIAYPPFFVHCALLTPSLPSYSAPHFPPCSSLLSYSPYLSNSPHLFPPLLLSASPLLIPSLLLTSSFLLTPSLLVRYVLPYAGHYSPFALSLAISPATPM